MEEEKETQESKRKEEIGKEGTPDTKRRRTQEEQDMLEELGLNSVEGEMIIDEAEKLIQEIEKVVEDNMEDFEFNEEEEAWDD
eukprot:9022235-Karenia_brevis.AAC.1